MGLACCTQWGKPPAAEGPGRFALGPATYASNHDSMTQSTRQIHHVHITRLCGALS